MKAFSKILVPIDFGEPSDRALELAIDLARGTDAELMIVHAFDVPPSYAGMDLAPMDLVAPIWAAAQEQLKATAAKVGAQVSKVTTHASVGVPWREILAAIEREHPDLVVMGTHGRRGLSRALLGSVVEKIVRLSPCPVLTTREVASA
jgi:nucleotide-binding universal stress UspA family protein